MRDLSHDEPEDILQTLDELWERVSSFLDSEDRGQPQLGDGLSRRDVAVHLARWNDWHSDAISEYLAGAARRGYAGYDDWNASWKAADAGVAESAALSRLRNSHQRLRTLLGTLQADQWDQVVKDYVNGCPWEHYHLHLGTRLA